eukprot:scaffold1740_cov150-Skeletonema_dohrnii-CCMP3373.AAC.5
MRIESASLGWMGWSAAGLWTASLPLECAQCHDEVREEIEDMCSLVAAFLHYCCECSKHWRRRVGKKQRLHSVTWKFCSTHLLSTFPLQTEEVLSTVEKSASRP